MRKLAIGDIHGGYESLIQLIDRINYDPINDKIIFLGDYIDGWPDSYKVLDLLYNMHKENDKLIFIRGNHDQFMIDFLNTPQFLVERVWYNQGGKATIDSYPDTHVHENSDGYWIRIDIPDNHQYFLEQTIYFHITEDNKGFVHGGYMSFDGLGNDTPDLYMWDRDIAYLLPMRTTDPTPRVLRPHNELYIGHTTTLNWGKILPINRHNKYFNIDTGGGWGGKLTAIDIDTKEIFQSDFVKDLYKNYNHGRDKR